MILFSLGGASARVSEEILTKKTRHKNAEISGGASAPLSAGTLLGEPPTDVFVDQNENKKNNNKENVNLC